MVLNRLALSCSTLDRAAFRRTRADLVPELLEDPGTAVLVVDGGRALVTEPGGPPCGNPGGLPGGLPGDRSGARSRGETRGPALALLDPASALAFTRAAWREPGEVLPFYLGEDTGRSVVALARLGDTRRVPAGPGPGPAAAVPCEPPPGTRWAGLREVGALLDDTGAGLMTGAVALAQWHASSPRCSRCGEPTDVVQAGWARSCPVCHTDHYPRTDSAVIMLITDDEDRVLLGRQASWDDHRYSCLAGFVEPGESLEAAVRREVMEEAGVRVGEVRYRGSQPWPFPSSLMVGFRGRALDTEVTVDGAELAEAGWWSRERLAGDLETGDLLLPGEVSIARRLVEEWFGVPIKTRVGL
ncbi:MAG: diphosphatase [Actinomycetota bacterium]|nr:diphosphatase [Actinomycetota bacterium]